MLQAGGPTALARLRSRNVTPQHQPLSSHKLRSVKRAIITGASSGIGHALTRELVRRGWGVAMLARRAAILQTMEGEIPNTAAFPCDVADREAVRNAARAGEDRLGGPYDLAIANAGISVPTWSARLNSEDATLVMSVNVFGMFHLFDAVIPSMVERGQGQFAGVASLAGLRGFPSMSVYSASKAAMQAFLEASRVELAPRGIGVTTINPGWVDTPIIDKHRGRVPFLVPVADAARIIADGLERRAPVIEFPLPMSLLVRTLRLLPRPLFDLAARPFGRRKIDESKVLR